MAAWQHCRAWDSHQDHLYTGTPPFGQKTCGREYKSDNTIEKRLPFSLFILEK
jgi:hypothetical protein